MYNQYLFSERRLQLLKSELEGIGETVPKILEMLLKGDPTPGSYDLESNAEIRAIFLKQVEFLKHLKEHVDAEMREMIAAAHVG